MLRAAGHSHYFLHKLLLFVNEVEEGAHFPATRMRAHAHG
jgi:hypothetical protein